MSTEIFKLLFYSTFLYVQKGVFIYWIHNKLWALGCLCTSYCYKEKLMVYPIYFLITSWKISLPSFYHLVLHLYLLFFNYYVMMATKHALGNLKSKWKHFSKFFQPNKIREQFCFSFYRNRIVTRPKLQFETEKLQKL